MNNKCLSWDDVRNNADSIRIHDYGFVHLKSVYGTDKTIAEAARISYGDGTKTISEDRNLIRYLVRNRHTSPIEQVCGTFIIKLPLFVFGQLVRHRTAKLNCASFRYSVAPNEYYTPKDARQQSTANKQGSDGIVDGYEWKQSYLTDLIHCQTTYQNAIDNNISRELARIGLPQSQYTVCVWQMDLHNLMHLLKLRMDKHAQQEIQEYANAIYTLIRRYFPITIEAFEDYILHSVKFSRMEIQILSTLLKDINILPNGSWEKYGMSNRELSEFAEKLNRIQNG